MRLANHREDQYDDRFFKGFYKISVLRVVFIAQMEVAIGKKKGFTTFSN
jgi:hypothetical protein